MVWLVFDKTKIKHCYDVVAQKGEEYDDLKICQPVAVLTLWSPATVNFHSAAQSMRLASCASVLSMNCSAHFLFASFTTFESQMIH